MYFHIKDGLITNKAGLQKAFALPDGRYELRITRKTKRSHNQNNYYWAVCVPMVRDGLRDMGHDVSLNETHDFLKKEFNCHEVVNHATGEVICVPKSTTDLTKEQFGEFLEKVFRFAAEWLNVTVPAPGSQALINY